MKQYVVNLTSAAPPADQKLSRGFVVSAATNLAYRFLDQAKRIVIEKGLQDQVAGFGEAYGLPMVTLTATPLVASLLEQLPGVDGVYADDDGMSLIS